MNRHSPGARSHFPRPVRPLRRQTIRLLPLVAWAGLAASGGLALGLAPDPEPRLAAAAEAIQAIVAREQAWIDDINGKNHPNP